LENDQSKIKKYQDIHKRKEPLAVGAFPRAIPEEGIAGGKQNDISLQPVNQKIADRGSASPAPAPLCIFRLTGFSLQKRD